VKISSAFAAIAALSVATADVSCGGHRAADCASCPQGNGAAWCNGDCQWLDNQCSLNVKYCGQNGATAVNCITCGTDAATCNSSTCTFVNSSGHTGCRDILSNSVRTASVHLGYTKPVSEAAWWFQRIVPLASSDVTYFAGVGNAFGYGGIQQASSAPFSGRVLFSIWDQGCDRDITPACDPSALAQTLACGAGVTCTDFGGEGTGCKSIFTTEEAPLIGREYFMAVQAAQGANGRAEYTGYFHSEAAGWRLLSRIAVNAGSKPWHLTGLYSFVEQWAAVNTLETRSALFGPSWMSAAAPLDFQQTPSAHFSLGVPPENFERVNAFALNGSVGIATGGSTVNAATDGASFAYPAAPKPALLLDFEARIPCLTQATDATAIEACLQAVDHCASSPCAKKIQPTKGRNCNLEKGCEGIGHSYRFLGTGRYKR